MRGNTPRVHIIRRRIQKGVIFVLLSARQKTFITNVLLQFHLKPPLFTVPTIFHLLSLQTLVEAVSQSTGSMNGASEGGGGSGVFVSLDDFLADVIC
jgi:hypothetical protein